MKSSITNNLFLLLAVYAGLAAKGVSASMIRGASSSASASDSELESVSRVLLRENPKRSLQRKLKATLSPSPTALPVKGPDYDPDAMNGRLEENSPKSPAPSALPVKNPDYDPAKFVHFPEKPRKESEGPRPAKLLKDGIAKAHTKTKTLQSPLKLKATHADPKARKKTTGLLGKHGAKMAHAVKEAPPPKTMVQMSSEVVDEVLEQGVSHSKVPQSVRIGNANKPKKSKSSRR